MIKINKRCLVSLVLTFVLTLVNLLGNANMVLNATDNIINELFFSEYIEGSSNNKAIEIYNGTNEDINLEGYCIELYTNGNTTIQSTENLSGILRSKDVCVLAHSNASAEIVRDINSNVCNFNGDDVLILKKGEQIIDSIGTFGTSNNWAKDCTMIRKSSIINGDEVVDDEFKKEVEWDIYDIDTFGNLGIYGNVPVDESKEEEGISDDTNISVDDKKNIKKISEIQGEGHKSSLEGQNVTVTGVVTAIVKGLEREKYKKYYIQDIEPDNNPNTSEAVFIFDKSKSDVKIGDLLEITGTVSEYEYKEEEKQLSHTQIKDIVSCEILSCNNELPEPIIIGKNGVSPPKTIVDNDNMKDFQPNEDAIDFYESLEYMRVKVEQPTIVGYKESYEEIYVLPDDGEGSQEKLTTRGGIKLSNYVNPEILLLNKDCIGTMPIGIENCKVGDEFNASIIGIMGYEYGHYSVYPTNEWPELINNNLQPEVNTIVLEDDKLTVASYNVENFSKRSGKEKAEKIANQIVNNLKSPDIVALI